MRRSLGGPGRCGKYLDFVVIEIGIDFNGRAVLVECAVFMTSASTTTTTAPAAAAAARLVVTLDRGLALERLDGFLVVVGVE
ncbi:MAG: hypothetical protein ABI598_00865, partial [Chloroflexota bacterium]